MILLNFGEFWYVYIGMLWVYLDMSTFNGGWEQALTECLLRITKMHDRLRRRTLVLLFVLISFLSFVAASLILWVVLWSCGLTLGLSQVLAAPVPRWEQADTLFRHLNTAQGLPQSTATALAEDRNGFLWVGTQGGLARWDGQRFRVYRPNADDPHSLPDGFVNCLYLDAAGNLWVGTNNGLARYLPDQDRFQVFRAGKGGLSHVAVTALTGDGTGGIWVGTERGLDHINAQYQVTLTPESRIRLPDLRINALLRSKNGVLWIGTRRGLISLDSMGHARTIPLPVADDAFPSVRSLLETSDGKIWVGCRQRQGGFWIDTNLEPHPIALPKEFEIDTIFAMLEVQPGQLWLGTMGQGVFVVNTNGEFLRQIHNDVRLPASLADNTVWSLFRDRSGLVWVGNGRGLSQHLPQQGVYTFLGATGRLDGLDDGDVLGIVSAADGRIWLSLGTNSLIAVLDPTSSKIERLKLKGSGVILAGGLQGEVYLASDVGLFRSTGNGLELKQLPSPTPKSADGQLLSNGENPFDALNVMLVEADLIWMGGNNGLWKLTMGPDGEIRDIHTEGVDRFTDQRITSLRRAADGQLWVGTENGLNLFNPQTRAIEQILPDQADRKSLLANSVSSLLLDHKKRLWVSSAGGGICLLEGRDAQGRWRFRRFGIAQGLPSMIAINLLENSDGHIIGSTEDGLISIDPDTLRIRTYQQGDGVVISSYYNNSAALTKKGEMLFGGAGGLTVVVPKLMQHTRYQAPVVVTEVRVGGAALPVGRLNNPTLGLLTLTPNANNLALEFAALDYASPERNLYQYRLAGYDNDWITTDATRRLASYTNLAPGEYTLQLRGSNRNGLYSSEIRSVRVLVLPAWYQTWWWRLLLVVLSLLLLGTVIQVRTRYLRTRQFQLQSEVRFRTMELRQKQNELVDANAELAQTADTLRLMGDVGRDITANLEQEPVLEALYHHVAGLLDVTGMLIYRINTETQTLDCCFAREHGKSRDAPAIALDSDTSYAARAVRERQEIMVTLTGKETAIVEGIFENPALGKSPLMSAMFVPLIVGHRVLGAMSVQSSQEQAYGERERLIFRTVCAYGAIALSNAEALDALHEAQHQLLQQEKMASLGGLVSGVAHEVNTPLGNTLMALSGAIDILRNQQQALNTSRLSNIQLEEYTNEGLAYAEMAQLTALRVAEMINSFKAIATSSSVDQFYDMKMTHYLPDVVSLVRSNLEHSGHQIIVQNEPDLILRIVPEALTEALARILSNVMHHAFVGQEGGQAGGQAGGQVKVLARREPDGSVSIEVSDNGCGISEYDLPKVFDPFFTTKSGIGGHVGLGLHIAYNHVTQRLKGSITITSVEQQGTTVTIRLPSSCCV